MIEYNKPTLKPIALLTVHAACIGNGTSAVWSEKTAASCGEGGDVENAQYSSCVGGSGDDVGVLVTCDSNGATAGNLECLVGDSVVTTSYTGNMCQGGSGASG